MENKQIEEMAKVTMKHCKIDNQCGSCNWSTCNECLADVLYNAGYRKASVVAREISQDIIEPIWNAYKNSTCQETVLLVALICETINNQLKKKYTESEKDK